MGTLLLSILLLVPSLTLQEVEVTGVQGNYRTDSCEVVARLTQSEIANLPVSNVADILAYLPNIDIRSRGASNAQTDVSLQGGTFDQVAVLLNGVPVSDAQTGHYAMNIPVSTALIERIEVLQGARADQTDALTGAINIITRDVTDDRYHAALSAGTNGYIAPVFAGGWCRNEVRVNSSVEYARSDGYYAPKANEKEQAALLNTDYQLANIYLQTRWKGLDVQTGAQYKDAGLGTGYGSASTDQLDATRTLFASARYNHSIADAWSIHAMASYRGQYDRYEWHRGTPLNRHWTHNTQAALEAQYHWPMAGCYTLFGAAFRDEYIRSSNMGEHNRWQTSLNAKQQVQWRQLTASLGISGHYNSWCGWYGSGAAHVSYRFDHARGAVYIDANRSLRMPTWTDMYYRAGVQRGSESVRAEKAWQLTVGGQYNYRWKQAGQLHVAADIYHRWGQDIIDWTYNETDSLFYATNQNIVNTLGVEAEADYRYNRWLRNISVRYAYTLLSPNIVNIRSNYLNHLRHKVVATVNHGIYVWPKGCIGATWSLRWQDRAGTYVDIYGTAGNAYQPVLLLDGSLYAELPHIHIALRCENMTNRHYYDYGGVLMPGVRGSVTVTAVL